MEKDYKEKIRKLLRLAESTNEHEAKAALLKARELMAEHKLSEEELGETGKQKISDVITDITFSKRRELYLSYLANLIGKQYCCQVYMSHVSGKQTYTVGIIGLEEDTAICLELMRYATSFVREQTERIRKENSKIYTAEYVKYMRDSYGYGFVYGLQDAYTAQDREKGWGLVMSVPPEAAERVEGCKEVKFESEVNVSAEEYIKGYKDGKEFDANKVISEKTKTEE